MQPPVRGMKLIPAYCGGEQPDFLMSSAWLGCVQFAMENTDLRKQFEEETGLSITGLIGRAPIEKMIDEATGYEAKVIPAFCDWVTANMWGEMGSEGIE